MHAAKLVLLEQWLRFYFLYKENEKYVIRLSDEHLKDLESSFPEVMPLVDLLNNNEMGPKTGLTALCECIINGPYNISADQGAHLLGGPEFHLYIRLLGMWVRADEQELGNEIVPFGQWRRRFSEWRDSPAVCEYIIRIKNGGAEEVHGTSHKPQ